MMTAAATANNDKKKRRVALISGAGFAGCALGALLSEQGWETIIVEKRNRKDFESFSSGFTLTMQEPGWEQLDKLGVASLRDKGQQLPYISVLQANGKELRRFNGGIFNQGLQVFRSDVLQVLYKRARTAGCTFWFDTTLESTEKLTLSNNNCLKVSTSTVVGAATTTDRQHQILEKVDLLIGADGIHSKVRHMHGMGEIIDDASWTTNFLGPSRGDGFLIRYGVDCYVVIAPTTRPGISNWVITSRVQRPEKNDNDMDDDAQLRSIVKQELMSMQEDPNVVDTAQELYSFRNQQVNSPHWSQYGCIALVGDAAHGMWHTSGLGGSLALADAGTLAALLEKMPIPEALEAYESERRPPALKALEASHKNMSISIPTSTISTIIRNFMLAYLPLAVLKAA